VTRKGPVPLAEDLDQYLSALGLPQVRFLVSLHKSWSGIAGPVLSVKAAPARFRNGVLTIAVRNHAWAQELQLCKPALLAKIVAATGPGSPVSDLRFVVGAVPAEEGTAAEPAAEPCNASAPDPEGLSSVSDPETREILRAISRRLRPRGE
jgi:predicted nucleic acid-binding Zn ribbon protein